MFGTKKLKMIGSFLIFCFYGPLVFGTIPPKFKPRRFANVDLLSNEWWSNDEDRAGICHVWLNYEKSEHRGGPKLFEYVNPHLFQRPSFSAFRDAFYRTRSEVRNAEHRANTWELRKQIFRNFLDDIRTTDVFQRFYDTFSEKKHEWFTSYTTLRKQLTEFWVPEREDSGFDYVFMGVVMPGGHNQPTEYGGMNNWVAFHLNEDTNLIHYHNKMTSNIQRFPNGNNPNLKRYGLISDVEFVYNDVRYNSEHNVNDPIYRTIPKTGHAMLLRTSPVFEFCLYTTIALLNNGDPGEESHGVHETSTELRVQGRAHSDIFLIEKTARIKIMGCPIDIRVKMLVNTNRGHIGAYITDAYPRVVRHSDAECNVQSTFEYSRVRASCGHNDFGLQIEHFQRNFTSQLKL